MVRGTRNGCRWAVVATAALLAFPGAATAFPNTLPLDAYAPTPGPPATATTPEPLETGVSYTITVSGTYSTTRAKRWDIGTGDLYKLCGAPEPAPMFASPAPADAGSVGRDAQVAFGMSKRLKILGCPVLPRPHKRFVMNLGDGKGFAHVAPVGGDPATPAPDHTYTYVVTGTGQPAAFQIADAPTFDNYGRLQIVVARSDAPGPPAPLVAPPVVPGGGALGSSSSGVNQRACISRRRFTIRVRNRIRVRRAVITVDGRPAPVRYGRRVTAVIDLSGAVRKTVTVKLRLTTPSGRTVVGTRVYRTCTARRPSAAAPRV